MIIFDLDGTLADCRHRRHFVDPKLAMITNQETSIGFDVKGKLSLLNKNDKKKWKPDWKAFFESCDKDQPIKPVVEFFNHLWAKRTGDLDVVIWSGRCESVRNKTEQWINKNLDCKETWPAIKMRSIGDSTPDDELKERWLDESCQDYERALCEVRKPIYHNIDFVVDDRPKVVRMWRRRGIFVFDVNQSGKEF